ncbi:MAG: glycosyltransferase [Candidatus Cloacimonetes bacterium]|nr:glycosyltransferase [Candidatus Cloacimonadota bacterium]
MNKKKILHLQLLPLLSGVQRFSLHVLEGLPADQYDIYVAGKPGGEFVAEVKKRGWNFLPLRTFRHAISLLDLAALLEIMLIIKKYRFDIVHTNSSKPGLLGRIAASTMRVSKIVHTVHGTAFQAHQHPLLQYFYMQMEKIGNALGDFTVFVNNSDRTRCLELGLVSRNKAVTIYNAIALKSLQKLNSLNRKTLQDTVTIGSTIRFSDQKNVLALLSAACKACHQYKNLRFIILGEGKHYSLCRNIVASQRLNEKIFLPGWDSDIIPWLAKFDVFILYSRWEAMPYSIIEAMHSGLPVIGSAIDSIGELVNEHNGWLVPLDNETELLNTLGNIAKNPKQILAKGSYARQFIASLCNYENMVMAYRKLYEGS